MRKRSIMFDAETLGTVADAVIMSIGAVRFDLETDQIDDDGFYASISIESNLDYGRRTQEDTMIWWMGQTPAAMGVFREPKIALAEALKDLSDWVGPNEHLVWSNGADFDLPMLAHAYAQTRLTVPWKFFDSRCVRTYKTLPQAANVKVPRTGTHHNALADALYQAQLVQAIHQELVRKPAPAPKKVAA